MSSSNGRKRTRWTTEARRGQLLQIGAELFAERPYDEVQITEVADLAEVSRGLLYHYFPTKQDFAIAITQSACGHVFAETQPDPDQPPDEQVRAVLDAYLGFAAENAYGYRAMHRGLIADPQVRAIRQRDLADHERRVLALLSPGAEPPAVLRTAVRGWLAFVIAVVLDWLEFRTVSRDEAIEVCIRALLRGVA